MRQLIRYSTKILVWTIRVNDIPIQTSRSATLKSIAVTNGSCLLALRHFFFKFWLYYWYRSTRFLKINIGCYAKLKNRPTCTTIGSIAVLSIIFTNSGPGCREIRNNDLTRRRIKIISNLVFHSRPKMTKYKVLWCKSINSSNHSNSFWSNCISNFSQSW